MVTVTDVNTFINRDRMNVFTTWGGFALLGAHCFAPPGVEPPYPWRNIDPLPEPVRLSGENPPNPSSNCMIRQMGAHRALAD
eukprot:4724401-Prorocentrum_lima.AAC.1